MEQGLLDKTGKSLEHWIEVLKEAKLEKHKAMIDYLKAKHGFTYGFANFVALKARKADAGSIDDNDLLAAQYKGKEGLLPIYEKLLEVITPLGDDITQTLKKSAVSIIRKKQFALIKPATKTRIDLGLKIKDKPTGERLEGSGPFGTMCTHRVRLGSIEEVDEELVGWLKEAYEKAG